MKLTTNREWAEVLMTYETTEYDQAEAVVEQIRKETIAEYHRKEMECKVINPASPVQ